MSEQTKRILILRESVTPEFVYSFLIMSVFLWIATVLIYFDTRNLDEPLLIPDKLIRGYHVVDSDSYLRFVFLPIIFSIVTICCFRFGRKEIPS